MHNPKEEHMEVARSVMRCLKGNPRKGILLRSNSELQVTAYSNFDWGPCPLTRCSLIGYLVTRGGSPIAWKTKKQGTVSHSSAEAEYRAMATITTELIWVKSFLAAIRIFIDGPMCLFCDNQAALYYLSLIHI